MLLQPDWRPEGNKMELLALIGIDRHDALVFPGSRLLKAVSRRRLRHLHGKRRRSPKVRRSHLGLAGRIKCEWRVLEGDAETSVALEQLTLVSLWRVRAEQPAASLSSLWGCAGAGGEQPLWWKQKGGGLWEQHQQRSRGAPPSAPSPFLTCASR